MSHIRSAGIRINPTPQDQFTSVVQELYDLLNYVNKTSGITEELTRTIQVTVSQEKVHSSTHDRLNTLSDLD
ncbi:unnamed protein product [Dicrocoelium dendriticum]|nr:unnamed protein product [Dicrocoelium dendriticum]